jgi:DNA-binding Xre family transcriptional regulator
MSPVAAVTVADLEAICEAYDTKADKIIDRVREV